MSSNSKKRLGRGLGGLLSGSRSNASSTPSKEPDAPRNIQPPVRVKASISEANHDAPSSKNKQPTEPIVNDGLKDFLEVSLEKVKPNPYQPRRHFDESQLRELADSIESEGLLQPIVVRQVEDGTYQLIAGERRFRACQLLKLKKIPARVLNVSDSSSAVIALIENLQREGLNPIEESLGYASLMRDFELTQESVAQRVGKGRATIANSLRLLQLDREIQGYLSKNMISTGHAKVLLSIEDESQRLILARKIVENNLSVRETERLVRQTKAIDQATQTIARNSYHPAVDQTVIKDLEKKIASKLNTRVQLKHNPKKGKIIIEYYGNDDLQRILDRTGLSIE